MAKSLLKLSQSACRRAFEDWRNEASWCKCLARMHHRTLAVSLEKWSRHSRKAKLLQKAMAAMRQNLLWRALQGFKECHNDLQMCVTAAVETHHRSLQRRYTPTQSQLCTCNLAMPNLFLLSHSSLGRLTAPSTLTFMFILISYKRGCWNIAVQGYGCMGCFHQKEKCQEESTCPGPQEVLCWLEHEGHEGLEGACPYVQAAEERPWHLSGGCGRHSGFLLEVAISFSSDLDFLHGEVSPDSAPHRSHQTHQSVNLLQYK